MSRVPFHFLVQAVKRELGLRYKNTFGGIGWVLVQPLLTLGVYWYVFTHIFKTRLPESASGAVPFVAFLAVALWPWTFFAEAAVRATGAITENSDLIGRVALPKPVLVVGPVLASLLLHFSGYVAVLTCLWLAGWLVPSISILLVVPLFLILTVFTLGVAWLVAAINVFVRDASQILPQLVMLAFFLTPILYPVSLVPESLKFFAESNPMSVYVGLFRGAVLDYGDYSSVYHWLLAIGSAAVMAYLGWIIFKRLEPHFEDFM